MMVTDIVLLDKRRCRICTDEEVAFVLYKGELCQYGIESGHELKEDIYLEILETVLFRQARKRALCLLESHERTEWEIREKLRDGGYSQKMIDSAGTAKRIDCERRPDRPV